MIRLLSEEKENKWKISNRLSLIDINTFSLLLNILPCVLIKYSSSRLIRVSVSDLSPGGAGSISHLTDQNGTIRIIDRPAISPDH